jgi:hypothetical protein
MATEAEIIASNILSSAIEYKRLYDTTKKNEYKVKEQRLRQIAENIKLLVAPTSSSSVNSFNGRTGAVILDSTDVIGALGYTPPTTLDELNDVTISAPANAQVLTYNAATGQWENQNSSGGGGSVTGYGSFYSDVTQTLAAINTPQAVTLGSTYEAVGTSTSGSRIYMDKAGTYQFSYVAQVANNANSQEYAEFWIKYNGVEYPNSNTRMILQPRKGAGNPSEQLMTLIINGTSLNDNDYIELFWEATSTQVSLKYEPVNASYPATPSIIANIIPIGAQGRDSNLNELNDVTITTPTNGQVLVYDFATLKWVNQNPASGSQWLDITGGIQYDQNIGVGNISLSRMTQVNLTNERNNFTVANYFTLTNGAVVYRNLSGGADVAPLVNGTTYYIQKIGGTSNSPSESGFSYNIWTGNYPSNQVFLFNNPGFTGTPIRLTQNIPANHFFEQTNRTITNSVFANKDFQIEDGLLFVNARQYKTGDTHWISPKPRFTDSYFDDGEGNFQEVENSSERESTLLIGPYFEYNTNPIINVQGTLILRSSYYRPFIGVAYEGRNYGITGNLDRPPTGIATTSIGGYFAGMGVKASEASGSNNYAFGVLASDQSGAGRLSVNFSVSLNKTVNTFNNVLDTPQGLVGINVSPISNSYNYIHIRQQSLGFGSSIIRIDNDSSSTTERSGISFYRSGNANPISGSTILGSLDFFGNTSGVNYTNYVFVDAAQMTIRAVSGTWSTAANRSAQFIWTTRHQNVFAERMRLTSEGNLLINTTTNGTFRLDVNGTARIQNALTLGSLASDPTGTNGMIYYNTTTNKFRGFENGAWVNLI